MTDSATNVMNERKQKRAARLAKRHRAESRFKWYGRISIGFGIACVLLLFTDIISKGAGAFTQT